MSIRPQLIIGCKASYEAAMPASYPPTGRCEPERGILLENGCHLLLENGCYLIREDAGFRLLLKEDGCLLRQETNAGILLN